MLTYLFICTYHTEVIDNKIGEQEIQLEGILDTVDENMTVKEMDKQIKKFKLSAPEFRIFMTKAISEGWKSLVTTNNDAIVSSWEGTGLNLPVNGKQDSQWKNKMVQKFSGEKNAREWDKQSYEYTKLRFFTKAWNGKSPNDMHSTQTQNIPPDPNQDINEIFPKTMDNIPPLEICKPTSRKSGPPDPNCYNISTVPPEVQFSKKIKKTMYDYYVKESDIERKKRNHVLIDLTNNNNNNNVANAHALNFIFHDDDDDDKDDDNESSNAHLVKVFEWVGLNNVYGVHCYALSWIQSFRLVPEFNAILSNYNAPEPIDEQTSGHGSRINQTIYRRCISILRQLYQLCNKIENPSKIANEDIHLQNSSMVTLKTRQFIDLLPPPFNQRRQQDVDEFHMKMTEIINTVSEHNSMNPTAADLYNDIFSFQTQSSINCHQCKMHRVSTTDTLQSLNVES